MKKLYKFMRVVFLSIFATTKQLENVEKELEEIWGKDLDAGMPTPEKKEPKTVKN